MKPTPIATSPTGSPIIPTSPVLPHHHTGISNVSSISSSGFSRSPTPSSTPLQSCCISGGAPLKSIPSLSLSGSSSSSPHHHTALSSTTPASPASVAAAAKALSAPPSPTGTAPASSTSPSNASSHCKVSPSSQQKPACATLPASTTPSVIAPIPQQQVCATNNGTGLFKTTILSSCSNTASTTTVLPSHSAQHPVSTSSLACVTTNPVPVCGAIPCLAPPVRPQPHQLKPGFHVILDLDCTVLDQKKLKKHHFPLFFMTYPYYLETLDPRSVVAQHFDQFTYATKFHICGRRVKRLIRFRPGIRHFFAALNAHVTFHIASFACQDFCDHIRAFLSKLGINMGHAVSIPRGPKESRAKPFNQYFSMSEGAFVVVFDDKAELWTELGNAARKPYVLHNPIFNHDFMKEYENLIKAVGEAKGNVTAVIHGGEKCVGPVAFADQPLAKRLDSDLTYMLGTFLSKLQTPQASCCPPVDDIALLPIWQTVLSFFSTPDLISLSQSSFLHLSSFNLAGNALITYISSLIDKPAPSFFLPVTQPNPPHSGRHAGDKHPHSEKHRSHMTPISVTIPPSPSQQQQNSNSNNTGGTAQTQQQQQVPPQPLPHAKTTRAGANPSPDQKPR